MGKSSVPGDDPQPLRGEKRFPFRDGAPHYRARGWTGIIPVARTGTKAPLAKGVTGHDGEDPSDEKLREMMRRHPSANIGLRLPWDVIGIDVDAYDGRNGHMTIMTLADSLGKYLPLTWRSTARMPGDGVSGIYLFRAPRDKERAWVTDLGAGSGVEIAQWHHRFATVPPSIHNTTGHQYRWWKGNDPATIPGPGELPLLPAEWGKFLLSPREYAGVTARARSEEVTEWYERTGPGEACRYMAMSLKNEQEKIRAAAWLGGLHDALIAAVTHLCRNAAEGHRGLDQALNGLEYEFFHSARQRNLRSEWTSAVSTAMASAAALPQEETDVCSIGRDGNGNDNGNGNDWRMIPR